MFILSRNFNASANAIGSSVGVTPSGRAPVSPLGSRIEVLEDR